MISEKKAIRSQIKAFKESFSEEKLKDMSIDALHILENSSEFRKSKTIMLFWSMRDELFTHDFINYHCIQKNIYLPKLVDNDIVPAVYNNQQLLKKHHVFDLYEPEKTTKLIDINEIELIVVPGIAFDKSMNRLGRGKGYYDRLLENYRGKKIGLCYDFQLLEFIPHTIHDIKMDKIITNHDSIS